MTTVFPPEPKTLTIGSIRGWLKQGWHDFVESSFISIAYAAIFCIIGGAALIWLLSAGMGLLFFVLAGGFMLVAPVLVTGYYQVSHLLRQGKEPVFDDIMASFRQNPPAVWLIAIIVALVFLLWISDAILIYSVYLGMESIVLSDLTHDPGVRGNVAAFFIIGSMLGGVLALGIYALTAFSIPYAFERRVGFGQAIGFSFKGVFHNLLVMLIWAAVLAGTMFATMLLALPLIIVVFPILAYASYAAYLDVMPD